MDWKDVVRAGGAVLKFELFTLRGAQVTVGTLVVAALIVLATFVLSRSAQRGVTTLLERRGVGSAGTIHNTRRLVHYFVLFGGIVAALQTVGIDLSTLFAAGAVFAVGLGFAMQNITQNFVSGIILLVERSIKVGDVLEVDREIVRVERMGIRSTVARTRNDEELIIPNSTLVQSTVKNFTLSDSLFLLRSGVGVTYGSDLHRVREVLEGVARELPWRSQKQEPRVLLTGFGSSSVDFEVFVYVEDPWIARRLAGDLNDKIWWALKEAAITIAFPQLDVHFDEPVAGAVAALLDARTRSSRERGTA